MNTIAAPPSIAPSWQPSPRLLTIADLAAMPRTLPSGDVRYELDDGRLVIMPPPGDIHGSIQANVSKSLIVNGQAMGLGKARAEVGLILRRNPDRLLGPDAVFIAAASLPVRRSKEGYLETIPELVIEIRSPSETAPAMQAKVDDYLHAGVVEVWVIDPEPRTVTSHRLNRTQLVFDERHVLAMPDVLPGFQIPVAELFEE